MEFEDFLEPEVGIAAAVVAAIASPKVRGWLRRGAVYGVAGVLAAGDVVTSFAKGVGQGAQNAAGAAAQRVPVQTNSAAEHNGETRQGAQNAGGSSVAMQESTATEGAGGES